LGVIVEFHEDFDVTFNFDAENGATHIFGDVVVYTGNNPNDESDEDDE
jgi:hypothetical protein